jgi:1,4-dihydroxy-2-naphthoyl-CoA hydrolase
MGSVSDMARAEQARESAKSGFTELIGLALADVGPDRVTATLPITENLLQPYGILHGGVLCSLVETLASVGAALWYADRGNVVGVSNHTDFLRASRSGTLDAVATPIHRGRSSQLWLVEVTDTESRLIARGQLRVANIENADRLAAPASSQSESS